MSSYQETFVTVMKVAQQVVSRFKSVKDLNRILHSGGAWDKDDYSRGVADGVEMAVSIMEDRDPMLKESAKPKFNMRETVTRATNRGLGHEPLCNIAHNPDQTPCRMSGGRE